MKAKLIGLLCCCLFLTQAQCLREVAVNDYLINYKPNDFNLDALAFTGDIDNCLTGTYNQAVNQKMLDRINYLRRLVQVSDDLIFDPALNEKCAEAAVMQEANRIINHCYGENDAPCNNWLCTSPTAIEASQNSLLAFANWNYFDPVELYIYDGGAVNTAVSHRRWLLYSKAKVFGNGLSENRNVLYVSGNSTNPSSNQKDFIAYPAEGYMPAPIVFPRWSFVIPGAYFGNADVNMINQSGQVVNLTVIHKVGGFPEEAIVWEPENIILDQPGDIYYTITISGIEDAPRTSYTYTTTVIQPVHPPPCLSQQIWSNEACACISIAPSCPDTLTLNTNILSENLYAANKIINSKSMISTDASVVFNAGTLIELLPLFAVEQGADFLIEIADCE